MDGFRWYHLPLLIIGGLWQLAARPFRRRPEASGNCPICDCPKDQPCRMAADIESGRLKKCGKE
jgi:hypothetical protein